MPNFPKNEYFLSLDTYTYVCVLGGKKCSFFVKFNVLCFLVSSVLKLALLPNYKDMKKKSIGRVINKTVKTQNTSLFWNYYDLDHKSKESIPMAETSKSSCPRKETASI